MFYKVEYQKRAHQEVEKIFRVLLPEQGLAVREEQIRLCHEMLDTLLGERIALCDAGVGIGKTYAYLVACVLLRKYSMLTGRGNPLEQRPVVVSTSSIALQKAIVTEYIPFLSRVLLEQGMIQSPLRAVVRKGKEHFVCDNRLEQRIEAIRHKQKNAAQKEALLSLRKYYDMDTVKDLSGFVCRSSVQGNVRAGRRADISDTWKNPKSRMCSFRFVITIIYWQMHSTGGKSINHCWRITGLW